MDIKDVLGTGEVAKEIVKQASKLVKEPVANLTNPTTKTVGQRLNDIVDLVFTPIELLKIYKDHSVDKFKSSLERKKDAIPEEKRVMPPLNVVGPAVEAAKYHIEDKTLREMFATLIATSMNSDTSSLAHPAFVEIIKQLSPFDAANISLCGKNAVVPLVDYIVAGKVKMPLVSNVALFPNGSRDIYAVSASITNLTRLGLVELDYNISVGDGSEFKSADLIAQAGVSFKGMSSEAVLKMIDLKHGLLRSTIYGRLLIAACVEQPMSEVNP